MYILNLYFYINKACILNLIATIFMYFFNRYNYNYYFYNLRFEDIYI